MSKGSKKSARKSQPSPPSTSVPAAAPTPALASLATAAVSSAVAGTVQADATSSWLDSSDPRRRMIGKIVVAAVWIYVAALWLLALDQTFNWGIFGPQSPPIP